jgi:hypothetical protein
MIYKGNDKIKAIYYGTTPISKVYKGSQLVFSATNTILTLNDYVPAKTTRPSGVSSMYVKEMNSSKTYKWSKTLTPGTYTFRFNYKTGMGAGLGQTKDVVTMYVDSSYQYAFQWQQGTDFISKIYLSTTGFKIEYHYHLLSVDNASWNYASYPNQYVTTVEII